jgi:hypothetical protein
MHCIPVCGAGFSGLRKGDVNLLHDDSTSQQRIHRSTALIGMGLSLRTKAFVRKNIHTHTPANTRTCASTLRPSALRL